MCPHDVYGSLKLPFSHLFLEQGQMLLQHLERPTFSFQQFTHSVTHAYLLALLLGGHLQWQILLILFSPWPLISLLDLGNLILD